MELTARVKRTMSERGVALIMHFWGGGGGGGGLTYPVYAHGPGKIPVFHPMVSRNDTFNRKIFLNRVRSVLRADVDQLTAKPITAQPNSCISSSLEFGLRSLLL